MQIDNNFNHIFYGSVSIDQYNKKRHMLLVWIEKGGQNNLAYSFSSTLKNKELWFNKVFNFFTCVALKIQNRSYY